MLRRIIVAGTVSAAGLLGTLAAVAPGAHAATGGHLCVHVAVNGSDVVNQCQDLTPPPLPPLPAPPSLPGTPLPPPPIG